VQIKLKILSKLQFQINSLSFRDYFQKVYNIIIIYSFGGAPLVRKKIEDTIHKQQGFKLNFQELFVQPFLRC